MTEPVTPGKGNRRDLWLSLALMAGVAIVLWFGHATLQDVGDRAAQGDVNQAMHFVRNIMLVAAVIAVGMTVLLARLLTRIANATLAQERFPPDGLPPWLEAEPRRGVAAIYLARRLTRCAQAMLVLAFAAAALTAWLLFTS